MSRNFNKKFEISNKIEFNPRWGNGTGYYDNAVSGEHAPVLTPGEMVASLSDNNRKIIMVGTPLGNVVIFQRYNDNVSVYTCNVSRVLNSVGLIPNGRISDQTMEMLIGDYFDNVDGYNINMLLSKISNVTKDLYPAK